MTERQRRFCDAYLCSLNQTQAAIDAGYSEKSAKVQGSTLFNKPDIKAYIEERMAEKDKQLVASQDEVLSYLTRVMRGESMSSVLARDEDGAEIIIKKPPDEKERLKAAELLGKCHGIFNEKLSAVAIVPVFRGEDKLED